MKLHIASAAAIAAALFASGVARADDALQTLGGMHMTAPVDWPTVPQTGAEGGRRQGDSEGQDQTAARIPH